jgi:hypothetical protein
MASFDVHFLIIFEELHLKHAQLFRHQKYLEQETFHFHAMFYSFSLSIMKEQWLMISNRSILIYF